MKKHKTLKILLIVSVIAAGCFFIPKKNDIHNLAFNNIEALAGGEGSSTGCMGTGSIECYGHYVEIKISGVRLVPKGEEE
ncbi:MULTISPECIES: NVEALA domain-containing protein [Parabacteroides]|uniref:NVEALA domain-containing protein n=1 Tax=Parabacteroides provencensis TaxID=1944636 RepID=UPI000C1446EE|nr:NVEALA domain-containing protein [Parabacteroides provencensis]